MGRNRPSSIASPIVVLNHGVSAASPANAEPLLLAPEVYAYRISEKPCAPVLVIESPGVGRAIATAVKPSTRAGVTRM